MTEYLSFALLCFTSFFTLINPLSTMPVFTAMTANLSEQERKKVIFKSVTTAFLVMLFFALTGQFVFNFFNITVHSFRVVGGILFFMMGWDMLQARLSKEKQPKELDEVADNDISITPLGIPMIAGPGVITNSIVLMEDAKGIEVAILIGTMILICLLTILIFLGSSKIMKFLGKTGNQVMMRIMGLIVMVIAVEFFFAGLKPILSSFLINN